MIGRVSRQEWRWALGAAVVIVSLATLPYLVAWLLTPAGKVYTGLLMNPLDGHTYLAKMRHAAGGDWLFRLPFTPETQPGVFYYEYHLLLGHLSAWFGLPLIFTYHTARVLGGLFLLLVGYRFIAEFVPDVKGRRMAFLILALSSGLGWVMTAFGTIGIDLWVAEANTFYSIFINAHFALAEALMLLIFLAVAAPLDNVTDVETRPTRLVLRLILSVGASLALALVFPLILALVYLVLGVFLLWRSLPQRQRQSASRQDTRSTTGAAGILSANQDWLRAIVAGLVSSPLLIYYVAVAQRDPVVAAWSAQNVTPSPPFWQILAGYGLMVPLAAAGVVWCLRHQRGVFLMIWTGLTLVLVYAPLALQRRLLMGFHIPVAMLAALGLAYVVWPAAGKRQSLATVIAFLLLLPTTLFILLVPTLSAMKGEWPLFMTAGENAALTWLQGSASTDDIVLASPEMGLLIPTWAGNRVVYGHPFETVGAAQKKAEVERFFAGETDGDSIMRKYGIRYIFVGPKEKALGDFDAVQLQLAWSFDTPYVNEEVTIYRVSDPDGGER